MKKLFLILIVSICSVFFYSLQAQSTYTNQLTFLTQPSVSTQTIEDFLLVNPSTGLTTKLDLNGVAGRIETINGINLDSEQILDLVAASIVNGTQQNISISFDDINDLFTFSVTPADGSETNINAGTNVTISGTGTSGDPYIINSTGGGGGGGLTQEEVEDIIGLRTIGGTGIDAVYVDGTGETTISLSGEEYTTTDKNKVDNLPADQNTINGDIESRTVINDAKISYTDGAAVTANTNKISADGSIDTHSDVETTGKSDGQVLKWSNANSRWEPAADLNGGGGGGGITTEQSNQLSNANTSPHSFVKTADFDFTSEDLKVTTNGSDDGKRGQAVVKNKDTVVGTIASNIGEVDDFFVLKSRNAESKLVIKPDAVNTPVFRYVDDSNVVQTADSLYLDKYDSAVMEKITIDTLLVKGEFAPYKSTVTVVIYNGQNAADPENEVDGIANTDANASFIITSESSLTPADGTHYLVFERTKAIGSSATGNIPLIGVSNGDNCNVTVYRREIVGTTWNDGLYNNRGWVASDNGSVTAVGNFVAETYSGVADQDNPNYSVLNTSSGQLNDKIGVDFIIVEILP